MSKIDPSYLPSTDSSADEWILWYQALKAEYGKDRAKYALLAAKEDRLSDQANNDKLREYLAKEGIDIEADWTDKVIDFSTDPFGFVSGWQTFTKKIRYVVIGIIVIVVMVVIFNPRVLSIFLPYKR